ncbi:DUF4183 domain-containing protein [Alicyclobacillus curvatus]|nr:DUF4183 domain-containing protein [Alicyclobacillus curvatus]
MTIQRVMRTTAVYFYAISDGINRTYRNADHVRGYRNNYIPNPRSVSLINVYINGVLQLPQAYNVTTGRIRLKTIDVPTRGTPIIVQSVRIYGWKGGGRCRKGPVKRGPKVQKVNRCQIQRGTKTRKPYKSNIKRAIKTHKEEIAMALGLIKLNIGATTTTNAVPSAQKFFYQNPSDVAAGSTLTVDAASFTDDTGVAVVTLPALAASNSYFKVHINGILQENGNSTYTPGATGVGSLAFANPAGGGTIYTGQWVILEVVNFAPASTTTVLT